MWVNQQKMTRKCNNFKWCASHMKHLITLKTQPPAFANFCISQTFASATAAFEPARL